MHEPDCSLQASATVIVAQAEHRVIRGYQEAQHCKTAAASLMAPHLAEKALLKGLDLPARVPQARDLRHWSEVVTHC